MLIFRTPSYAPHVLAAGSPRIGRARRRQGHTSEWQQLWWHCLWVIQAGQATLQLDDNHTTYSSPCALMIPAGQHHRLTVPAGTLFSRIEWGVTNVSTEQRGNGSTALRYRQRRVQPSPEQTWGVTIPILLPESLYDGCNRMVTWVCSQWWRSPFAHAAANGCLAQWLGTLMDTLTDAGPRTYCKRANDPAVQELLELAQQHLDKTFTIERWAMLAGMSRQQLNITIRNATGETARQQLKRIRLSIAESCLVAGESIQQTALRSGFTTADSFTRWFRTIHQEPPSTWRDRHQHIVS